MKKKDPVARLRKSEDAFPFELRLELFAMGERLAPRLIELVLDEKAGWARVHAVDLLVDLQIHEAITPMLSALADYFCSPDWEDVDQTFSVKVTSRLPEMGAAVLEPALAFFADNDQREGAVYAACDVLVELGIKDPRVYAALTRAFEADACLGAEMLAQYGDPRGSKLIASKLEQLASGNPNEWATESVRDLFDALDELDGSVPSHVRIPLEAWLAESGRPAQRPSWGPGEPGQA